MTRTTYSFALLILSTLFLFIAKTAAVLEHTLFPILNIQTTEFQGSLWSQSFSASSIYSSNFKIEGFRLNGLSLLHSTIEHISIENFNVSELKESSSSWTPAITIKQLKINEAEATFKYLRPIRISNLSLSNQRDIDLSFMIDDTEFIATAQHTGKDTYDISAKFGEDELDCKAALTDNAWVVIYKNQTIGSYHPFTKAIYIQLQEERNEHKLAIDLSGALSKRNWIVSFAYSHAPSESSIQANLDTANNIYNADINLPELNLKVYTSPSKDLLVTGKIVELKRFTPLASGTLSFRGLQSHQDNLYLTGKSDRISLAVGALEEIDISYIPSSSTPFKATIGQIYSPGLAIEDVAITSANTDDITHFNVLFKAYGKIQSTEARASFTPEAISLILKKTNIRTSLGVWLSSDEPTINITENRLSLEQFNLRCNDSEIKLNGDLALHDQSWSINLHTVNLPLSISSSGLINIDTNIDIENANLDLDLQLTGQQSIVESISGQLIANDISAYVSNLAPTFLFPLNYSVTDGHIHCEFLQDKTFVTGKLTSPQGEIEIDTSENRLHIQSSDLQFNYDKNHIQSKVDIFLNQGQHKMDIQLQPRKFSFYPDQINKYEVLPNDMIVKRTQQPLNTPQKTKTNVSINTDSCDIDFLGFIGKANINLTSHTTTGSNDKVTGTIQINDPALNILNRQIKLNQLNLSFNSQPWLKGNITLETQQNLTFINQNKQSSQNQAYINISGEIRDPNIDIGSKPIMQPQLDILLHLLSSSKVLPPGNENLFLIEYISGISRSNHAIGALNLINNIGAAFNVDISLQKSANPSENKANESELVLTKKVSDRLWVSIRHQLNDLNPNMISLSLKLRPNISLEGQYNQNTIGASILYSN
jgi:hypothetical protein